MGSTTPDQFARYWTAATASSIGTAVTTVALPVLVVRRLGLGPVQVGAVNAAQFLPYALFGLLAGVYVDRWPRHRVLVWSSVARAAFLGAIPVAWALGGLDVWLLVALLLGFGTCSVFGFAATQSLLPQLVASDELVRANARLDQSDTAAQTLGPVLGGWLVRLLGAPLAIGIDAVSYLVDALLNAGLDVDEPRREPSRRHLLAEVAEGLRWTYRHPTLGPLALSTHVWFLANSAGATALAVIALRTLGLSPVGYSLLLTASGVAALLGASLAPAVGRRLRAGRAVVLARGLYPLGWLAVATALHSPAHRVVLYLAMALLGLAAGVENPNEMGYWQQATPDHLLGRVNATRRSVNRTVAVAGSVLGGLALARLGGTGTALGVAGVFGLAAALAALGPLWRGDQLAAMPPATTSGRSPSDHR